MGGGGGGGGLPNLAHDVSNWPRPLGRDKGLSTFLTSEVDSRQAATRIQVGRLIKLKRVAEAGRKHKILFVELAIASTWRTAARQAANGRLMSWQAHISKDKAFH